MHPSNRAAPRQRWRDALLGVLALARGGAERALAQERQRLASLIAVTGVGTWEWNLQTGDFLVNDRYAALFGRTRATMPGFSIEDAYALIHPDERAASRETVRRLAQGEIDS